MPGATGTLGIDLLQEVLAIGINEEAIQEVEEVIPGGAVHRPMSAEPFIADENLLDDDIAGASEPPADDASSAASARAWRQPAWRSRKYCSGSNRPSGWSRRRPVTRPWRRRRKTSVHRREDVGLLDADGGQVVDVEEPAIVNLLGGHAPVAETIGLRPGGPPGDRNSAARPGGRSSQ